MVVSSFAIVTLVLVMLVVAVISLALGTIAYVDGRKVEFVAPTLTPLPTVIPSVTELTQSDTVQLDVPSLFPTQPSRVTFEEAFVTKPDVLKAVRSRITGQECSSSLPVVDTEGFEVLVTDCPLLGFPTNSSATPSSATVFRLLGISADGSNFPCILFRLANSHFYFLSDQPEGTSWPSNPTNIFATNGGQADMVEVGGLPAACGVDAVNELAYYRRAAVPKWTSTAQAVDLEAPLALAHVMSLVVLSNLQPAFIYGTTSDVRFSKADDEVGDAWSTPSSIPNSGDASNGADLQVVNGFPAVVWANAVDGLSFLRAQDETGSTWGSAVSVVPVAAGWSPSGTRLALTTVDVGLETRPMVVWLNDDGTNTLLHFIIAQDSTGSTWDVADAVGLNVSSSNPVEQGGFDVLRLPGSGQVAVTLIDSNVSGPQWYVLVDGNQPNQVKASRVDVQFDHNEGVGLGLLNQGPATAFLVGSDLYFAAANKNNVQFLNNMELYYQATGLA